MSSKRPPKTGSSGEHPAVIAYRRKLDSITEHEAAELDELTKRIEKLRTKDPRRDGDSDPPVDEVRPSTLPTPIPKKADR